MEDISNIQTDLKREKDKQKYQENSVRQKMQAKKKYHENLLTISSRKEKDWANKFRKQIFEGPFLISTVCHRCLYFQSVFIKTKYEWYKNRNMLNLVLIAIFMYVVLAIIS